MLPIYVGFYFLFTATQMIASSLDLKSYGVMNWGWTMLFGIFLAVVAFFMILDPFFGLFNVVYLTSAGLMLSGISSIMLSTRLKQIKEETIDKVQDFKKLVNNSVKDLKNEVLENIQNISEEDLEELRDTLNNYENRVKNSQY